MDYFTALFISLLVISYQFWAIIALWPPAVLVPIIGILIGGGIAVSAATIVNGYEYMTEVYPEAKAIRQLLVNHHFFKPSTSQTAGTALVSELDAFNEPIPGNNA